jgi:hypothetical protein
MLYGFCDKVRYTPHVETLVDLSGKMMAEHINIDVECSKLKKMTFSIINRF